MDFVQKWEKNNTSCKIMYLMMGVLVWNGNGLREAHVFLYQHKI